MLEVSLLMGLGCEGIVIEGPNDKGRWEVQVDYQCETKTFGSPRGFILCRARSDGAARLRILPLLQRARASEASSMIKRCT